MEKVTKNEMEKLMENELGVMEFEFNCLQENEKHA